jgi:hypothetical protein
VSLTRNFLCQAVRVSGLCHVAADSVHWKDESFAQDKKMRAPPMSTVWGPSEVEALSAPMAATGGKAERNKDGSWTLKAAGEVCLRL